MATAPRSSDTHKGLQQTEQCPEEHRHESHTGGNRQSTTRVRTVFCGVASALQLWDK